MSLYLMLSIQTVSLSPPVPVIGRIIARSEPGVPLPLSRIRRLLKRCLGPVTPWAHDLEIRWVSLGTLSKFNPRRADNARRGRYLRKSPKSPAIIYVGEGRDANHSLLHEWLHHQDELQGRHRSEEAIEAAAAQCLANVPPQNSP
ncbi:MAG: hypothetical protein VX405_08470 [Myxococcota bacterium]|nr:hypothetical protein [Myxococcota bacterium]